MKKILMILIMILSTIVFSLSVNAISCTGGISTSDCTNFDGTDQTTCESYYIDSYNGYNGETAPCFWDGYFCEDNSDLGTGDACGDFPGCNVDDPCMLGTGIVVCGDGSVGGSEVCDDGNLVNNDGCSSTCTLEYATGSGTSLDPYIIIDCIDLQAMKWNLTSYYELGNNIDCNVAPYNTGSGFEPVGDNLNSFQGNFDGKGFTISGLYINSGSNFNGVFGKVNNAAFSDVHFNNVNISGIDFSGTLVGYATSSTITNINLTNINVTTNNGDHTGALAGVLGSSATNRSTDVNITNAHATNVYITGDQRVGGLVGTFAGTLNLSSAEGIVNATNSVSGSDAGGLVGSSFVEISNSYANVIVVASSSNSGGLVGVNNGVISNSYAKGDVMGTEWSGGLVGLNYANITSSYAKGNVFASNNIIGGLVGFNWPPSIIINSYAKGDVSGLSNVGGLVGRAGGSVNDSYSKGSVSGTSNVGGLIGYNLSGSTISNSYYNSETSGQSDDTGKGTPKTTAEMKNLITFSGWSSPWNFKSSYYPKLSLFITEPNLDGLNGVNTTDFAEIENMTSVTNMVLANNEGTIQWSNPVNAENQDYATYVTISNGIVSVDTSNLDNSINNSATVTLNSVDCNNFDLYYGPGYYSSADQLINNGVIVATQANVGGNCTDATACTTISCSNNELSFTALHFSGFASDGISNLTINDTSEGTTCAANSEQVTFYAYLMEVGTGNYISGADCNITMQWDGTQSMIENITTEYYQYTTICPSGSTIYDWNVTCDKSGINLISMNDTIESSDIGGGSPTIPEFSTVGIILALIIIVIGVVMIKKKNN